MEEKAIHRVARAPSPRGEEPSETGDDKAGIQWSGSPPARDGTFQHRTNATTAGHLVPVLMNESAGSMIPSHDAGEADASLIFYDATMKSVVRTRLFFRSTMERNNYGRRASCLRGVERSEGERRRRRLTESIKEKIPPVLR